MHALAGIHVCVLLAFCRVAMAQPGDDRDEAPRHEAELVFPLDPRHNHAPGIVELPGGELLMSWFRGSGERKADDVAVFGARRPAGGVSPASSHGESPSGGSSSGRSPSGGPWTEPFLMADRPGFPDCNTAMMVDGKGRLWLFWPTILANTWESCLTNLKVADDPSGPGAPRWTREGLVLLKPDDFSAEASRLLDELLGRWKLLVPKAKLEEIEEARRKLGDKLYQRIGWQPRCKPTVLPSGRILLPLYTDTFSISIMAISDDGGETWRAGKPLIGFGNIQPSVLRRDDGVLVAYMRENGPLRQVRVSESKDDGETWGPVGVTGIPNPGSGLDAVRLANGRWVLVHNDTLAERNRLAVSLSDDEGRTWKWTRHLEDHPSGSYHYPSAIQARDGTIHVAYSYFVEGGKSMKHAAFHEAWIRAGD